MEDSDKQKVDNVQRKNDEKKPSTSNQQRSNSAINLSDVPEKRVTPFHPGKGGFSGNKLKVAKRSYTARPVVPAKKGELIAVAKAMHREQFEERLQDLFAPETEAAIKSIQSGLYVGWRCQEYTWDCIRVGDESMCFCGHRLRQHSQYNGPKSQVPCSVIECRCRAFAFIPGRPEDVGEFWLQRRPSFDPSKWKAKCRCKHPHTDHATTGIRQCTIAGCRCGEFQSNFLCAACDRHWEEHETYFDTEQARKNKGLPHGEACLPFAEMPKLRNMALTGKGNDDRTFKAITNGGMTLSKSSDNNTPVPFGYGKSKKSPFE